MDKLLFVMFILLHTMVLLELVHYMEVSAMESTALKTTLVIYYKNHMLSLKIKRMLYVYRDV